MSEIQPSEFHGVRTRLEVTVYEPCSKHKHWVVRSHIPKKVPLSTQYCGCAPIISGHSVKEDDLMTGQWAQIAMATILASTQTVRDTSNATHSVAAGATASTVMIYAGLGTTTPAVQDYVLTSPQTDTPAGTGKIAGTVSAATESGASGSFTVTGTITNGTGANITYTEIGVSCTIATYIYLLSHDLINTTVGYVVSPSGTMACTLTVTNS